MEAYRRGSPDIVSFRVCAALAAFDFRGNQIGHGLLNHLLSKKFLLQLILNGNIPKLKEMDEFGARSTRGGMIP
jgi:hypothetical protein